MRFTRPVRSIIIPPFSRLLERDYLFFFSSLPFFPPPFLSTFENSRGSLRSQPQTVILRKYELLNLDKGSRLGYVLARVPTCPAIRRPNAGGLPVIKCNLGDCLFTPRDSWKPCNEEGGNAMRPVCKNHKHRCTILPISSRRARARSMAEELPPSDLFTRCKAYRCKHDSWNKRTYPSRCQTLY